jgi:tight adherence protein B
MFDLQHIGILITVFAFMMGVVRVVPELWDTYRERYRVSTTRTSRELSKFFINIKPGKIIAITMVVGVLLGFLLDSWVIAAVLAISGVFAPKVILKVWRDIRTGQVEAQLMDALILIGSSLKSGLDIAAGIERVATTMKAPISEEFGLVINSYRLGTPLEAALLDLTDRIPSRTLETVIYAINIQRETGGNIIKTFEQLVVTIREETKLQKKVQAMTSQGRMQIVFLAIFPWFLALVFFVVAKEMMVPVLQSTTGQLVLVGLLIWEGIGVLVTKKVVEVRL